MRSTNKDEILHRVARYYNSHEKALEWYKKPHNFFSLFMIEKASPKQMVEAGQGKQVLEWVKIVLGD